MSAKNLKPSIQPTEIRQLSLQSLSSVKSQIDEELSKLEANVGVLKLAISKYSVCLDNLVQITANANCGEDVLINLSKTLYVQARLTDVSKALVDVGEGYYARMDIESAKSFFQRKIDFAACKIEQISSVIQEQKGMRQVIAAAIKKKI